jgi:DnaJ-class molecular chaperone
MSDNVAAELAALRRRVTELENRKPPCKRCKGSGKQPGLHNKCGRCWGTGEDR